MVKYKLVLKKYYFFTGITMLNIYFSLLGTCISLKNTQWLQKGKYFKLNKAQSKILYLVKSTKI